MPGLGAAYVTIRGDLAGLKTDLNKAMDQIKGLEGSVDKASSNMTSAFNKVSTAVKGIAAAYALIKSAGMVSDIALAGARYETLGVVMGVVGKNAKYSAEQMETNAKALQSLGISMTASREATIKAVQAHIQLADSLKLARIAQDAAVIGNTNSSEALERMMYGIQTAQVEVLKSIGINVNFENSYKRLAGQLGKTAESLSEAEKLQARLNVVMAAGKDIAGTYEAAMTTAGKQINSFKRYLDDFQVKMGMAFGPATTVLVEKATEAMKKFTVEIETPESQENLKNIANGIAAIGAAALEAAGIIGTLIGWIGKLQALGEESGAPFSKKYVAELNKELDALDASMVTYTGKINEATKGWENYKKQSEPVADVTKDITESLKDQKKRLEELKQAEEDLMRFEENRLEEIMENEKKKQEAYRKTHEAHDQYDAEEISRVDREMWEAEIKAAKDAKKKIEEDAKASLKKQEEDQKHYLERVQDATADTFYDIFQNTDEGFRGLFDRVGDYFLKMLAEMAAQAIAKPIIVPIIQSLVGGLGGGVAGGSGTDASGLLQMAGNTIGNNYFGNTSIGGYLSGALNTPLYTPSPGAFGPSPSYTVGNALTTYGLGSLGYQYLGGAVGLPQSEYSGYGAGLGAVGGQMAGGALASGALAGTAYGAYAGPIGAIVGAIVGGVAASFLGGDGNRHMTVAASAQPSWSYGENVSFGAASNNFRYRSTPGSANYDSSTNPFYGNAFGAMEDALNTLTKDIYAKVDELIKPMPDEIESNIRSELEGLSIDFPAGWQINSEDVAGGLSLILNAVGTEIWDKIQPVLIAGYSKAIGKTIGEAVGSDMFSRLDSNNLLKTSLTDSGYFNADYGMAEGVSFENYTGAASEWLNTFNQVNAVLSNVDATVEGILHPLSEFDRGIQGIENQFDTLEAALRTVGASTEEFTRLTEAETQAIADYTSAAIRRAEDERRIELERQEADRQRDIRAAADKSASGVLAVGSLTQQIDGAVNAFGMTEWDMQRKTASQTVAGWQGDIAALVASGDMSITQANILLGQTQKWLTLTNDGIDDAIAKQEALNLANLKSAALSEAQGNIAYLSGMIADLEGNAASAKSEYIGALNDEINALQAAQEALEPAFESAKSIYQSALQSEISSLTDQQNTLESNAASAKQEYIDSIRREIEALGGVAVATEEISKDWAGLAETLREAWDSLFTGAESPLGAKAKMGAAGDQFRSAIQAGFGGNFEEMQKLPGLASGYLSAARGATANRFEYDNIFAQVQAQLGTMADIAGSKVMSPEDITAENTGKTVEELQALLNSLMPPTLSMADAAEAYYVADMALQNSNFETQIATLETELAKISDPVKTLQEASDDYYAAKTALDASTYNDQIDYYSKEADRFETIVDLDTARNNYLIAQNALITSTFAAEKVYWEGIITALGGNAAGVSTAANAAYMDALPQASGGGVFSGPDSGYPVMLHGTERVTKTEDDNEIKELLSILISEVRRDKEYNKRVHRILDRVSAGQNSLLTRAA